MSAAPTPAHSRNRPQLRLASMVLFSLAPCLAAAPVPIECSYQIVNSYPHDRGAFTQGLLYSHGMLYESTGHYGQSTLREVELKSGRVLRKNRLPAEDFGEGLALVNNQLAQLTWTSGAGYVWDRGSFTLIKPMPFLYPSPHAEGQHQPWGLCYDNSRLILSNGSNVLHFLDPDTFEATGAIAVHDNNGPVPWLNELECINGKVYANVWRTDLIVVINPDGGEVTARMDLTELYPLEQRKDPQHILNGIAYNAEQNRLFVTGKYWPKLYELELTTPCLTP